MKDLHPTFYEFHELWREVDSKGFEEAKYKKLCMKLEVNKGKKVTEPNFSGKFSFHPNWTKMPQYGPKMEICNIFSESAQLVFSDFLHVVRGP